MAAVRTVTIARGGKVRAPKRSARTVVVAAGLESRRRAGAGAGGGSALWSRRGGSSGVTFRPQRREWSSTLCGAGWGAVLGGEEISYPTSDHKAVVDTGRVVRVKSRASGGLKVTCSRGSKTRKSVAKRFRKTGSGKIVFMKPWKNHNLSVKNGKRKRRITNMDVVRGANFKAVKKCIPAYKKGTKAKQADRGPEAKFD